MAKKKRIEVTDTDLSNKTLHEAEANMNHPTAEPGGQDAKDEMSDKQELVDPVTALKSEIASMNDKYLRLYSEFDNYRKRTMRERAELIKTSTSGLITQLLPVIDDFERALHSLNRATDVVALREGVELIYGKFRKTLEQKGLEEIKAVGELFDTDHHEAITNIPATDESQKGIVVEEIEKGYMLNGAVIRFAKVAVAN